MAGNLAARGAIIIPARYGSTRFPGKPLADIFGISLLERVWRIASSVVPPESVYIATDDERIGAHVEGFGGQAIYTGECRNGTERVKAAIDQLEDDSLDFVVNLQGDAVLTPPWVITAIASRLMEDDRPALVTPYVKLEGEEKERLRKAKEAGSSSGTLVVFNSDQKALYFSKAFIPFFREGAGDAHRHIGIYGYSIEGLNRYLSLPEGELEKREGLEQLRALEAGMEIDLVEVEYKGRTHHSVDTPEDLEIVKDIINREGELLS